MSAQGKPRRFVKIDPYPASLEQKLADLSNLPDYGKRIWLQSGNRTHYPRFVYRYLGPSVRDEYLCDYLVESLFYLNSVEEFNDPFDMGAYVTVSSDPKKRIEKFKKILKVHNPQLRWKQRQKEINKMMLTLDQWTHIQSAYEQNILDVGTICFTRKPKDLLMWSHYGGHHRGISLQFHLANDIRTMGRLLEVNYSPTYPTIDWIDDMEKGLGEVLSTKNSGWEYEKEYRILIAEAAKSYLAFHPKALTGLIFGCRADQEMKERVLNLLEVRATKKLSPVKVYKAVRHPREYKITIQKDHSLNWPS
jgi:hypothetical protein